MIVCMWAGGLQVNSTDGVRYTLGMNNLGAPDDSTVYPQVTGQRRLHVTYANGREVYIPDQSVNSFPANASRTWIAAYNDIVIEDTFLAEALAAGATTETGKGHRLASLRFGTVTRDLRIYGIMNHAVDGFGASANAAVTTTANTLSDTRQAWAVDAWANRYVVCGDKKMLIASNTATVLTGSANWIDSTPASGLLYSIQSTGYPKHRYKVFDNTPTLIATGDARTSSRVNTTPIILDFQWVASLVAASNTVSLRVDGVADTGINGATGGTTVDPGASVVRIALGTLLTGSKGSVGAHGDLYFTGYSYDNLAQTNFDTYPKYSAAPPAHGAGSSRPVIGCRQPLAGGTPKAGYDQWTKSAGTDAAALLDEAPDNDATDFISETVLNEKQAIPHETLANMTVPAYSYDTFYAVQAIGYAKTSALAASLKVFLANATADDAGMSHVNTSASANLVYCAILDPSAATLTLTTIEAMQTVVQVGTDTASHKVESAAQLVLFTQGVARSLAYQRRSSQRAMLVR